MFNFNQTYEAIYPQILLILCFRYVAKVSSNDDHPCNPFLTKDHHSYNRTTLLDGNIFNKFT